MSAVIFECEVPECGRAFDKAQGLALHMTRTHADYDPAVARAEAQIEPTTVEFAIAFEPDEMVLLQAWCFLRGGDVTDAALEAFADFFRWCREQDSIETLIALRDAWRGALVDRADTDEGNVVAIVASAEA